MNKEIEYKLLLIFGLGLLIRLIFAPYTRLSGVWEKITILDELFIAGDNPLIRDVGWGASFYLFYIPSYIVYLILNCFDSYHTFLLLFMMKIPPIVGDVIIFYSLYEIVSLISEDKKKSLWVATAYFLNPYSIWLGSIVGTAESLMVGFMLLSLLYLLKRKIGKSAVCLSIGSFFRYLPVFLVPCFVAYLWRRENKSTSLKFFAIFFLSSLVLSIPYLPILPTFTLRWIVYGGVYGGLGLEPTFTFNFTGFLATLGIWPSLKIFFGYHVFLVLYIIAMIVTLKHGRFTGESVVRFIPVFFSLFMVVIPLCQHHYLMWMFPFLLLASMVFSVLPWYYPHVFWVSNLALDLFIGQYYVYIFDDVFPGILTHARPFLNLPLMLSVSVMYGLFLILTIVWCLTSSGTHNATELHADKAMSHHASSTRWLIFLMVSFSVYCLLEILRVAYGWGTPYISLIFIGFFILATLSYDPKRARAWKYVLPQLRAHTMSIPERARTRAQAVSKYKPLYSTHLSKGMAFLHLISLSTILSIITVFHLDIPIFLLIQILTFGGFWLLNKRSMIELNIQRISFSFTSIYIAYLLIISKNMILGSAAIFYFISWVYLQIVTERAYMYKK